MLAPSTGCRLLDVCVKAEGNYPARDRRRREMAITRRIAMIGGVSLFASAATERAQADWGADLADLGEGLEDFWLATDAYIYGYPLVTMASTRRGIRAVAGPGGTRAPMGHLIKLRQ